MKTLILSAAVALTAAFALSTEARADHHHHGSHYHGPAGPGHFAPRPVHVHPPYRAYGGYGYVAPSYGYTYVAPAVPVAPAPVYVPPTYVAPTYAPYYPQSGISLYGKNFGFQLSN